MEKGSFLRRAADALGKVFSGDGKNQNKAASIPGFTKAEERMLRSASRMEIIGGNYKGAAELSAMVFKARAERLKSQQPQMEFGEEEDHQP